MAEFDDYLDDVDDDDFNSANNAGADDIDQRSEAFDKEVARNVKIILSPRTYKPAQRLEAVRWLGESGAIRSIPELVKVYEKDKTSGMKEAAAFALGQLKMLEIALDDDEIAAETYEKIARVQLYGELGKRVNSSGALLRQAGLLISALIFVTLALFAPQMKEAALSSGLVQPTRTPTPPVPTATATPDTPEVALEALVDYYTALLSDADALAGQLSVITRGESQACEELANNFNDPQDFILSAQRTEDNLTQLAQQLNDASALIDPVRAAFNDSCAAGTPIEREQALNEYFDSVVAAQRLLRDSGALLRGEAVELPATPTYTPMPSPQPTATVDIAPLLPHIRTLEVLISDMTGLGSPTASLINYWSAVRDFGGSSSLEGCLQSRFTIPDDYIVPSDLATQFLLLQQAADSVNLGLLITRQTNETFFSSCERNQFPTDVVTWIQRTEAAQAAFNEAQSLLDQLRG